MWQRDSGNNASPAPAKKRSAVGSALRFAYVPRFGHNIGEAGRVLGLFPRLLAGIFAMKGMFPRQHPALRDEALRLRITDVLRIAYASLQWNRAGVPNILFFFGVVASLVFSIVAAVFAIMGFFSAPAHAMPSMFTSPSPTTDLGNTWLDHIFKQQDFSVNVPLTDANNVPSQNTETTIGGELPLIFNRLAGMYSTAMLVLAVIILVYHLIGMTAMTAHEGTAMGRSANKVWAPVRLVFALGLLVPIANGFSSGQWLMMWIAKQGSGLASYVWGNTGSGIGNTFMAQGEESRTSPVTLPVQMLTNLATIGGCGVANQMGDGKNVPGAGTTWYRQDAAANQLADPSNSLIIPPGGIGDPRGADSFAAVKTAGKDYSVVLGGQQVNTQSELQGLYSQNFMPYFRSNGGSGSYQTWNDVKPCGQVTFPEMSVDPNLAVGNPRDAAMVTALSNAHIAAYRRVYYRALQAGAVHRAAHASRGTLNPTTRADLKLPDGSTPDNLGPYLEELAKEYRATFAANVNGAVTGLSYDTKTNEVVYRPSSLDPLLQAKLSGNPLLGTNGDLGWMSAAGFYLKMATANSLLQRSANNTPLVTTGFGGVVGDVEKQIASTVGFKGEQITSIDGVTTRSAGGDAGNIFSDLVMKIMAAIGLANDRGQWIWQTQFTSNYPLSDILNLGQKLINSALTCIWVGAALNLVMAMAAENFEEALAKAFPQTASTEVNNKENKFMAMLKKMPGIPPAVFDTIIGYLVNAGAVLLAAIPTMLFALAGIMLLPGIILFFVLPTLPFLNFLTGILTWMISLLSAVVAIPVIAIAHLTPQGEGLPSQTARGAYTMILQIFLRPVMMIFGLLIFVLVMNTGIPILNTLFFGIYKLSASSGVPGILSSLAFFVLYAAAAFGICNIAISAIDDLPMKAVQWIGGSTIDTNHDVSKLGAYIIAQGAQGAIQGSLSSINQATRNGNMIGNARNAIAQRNMYNNPSGGGGAGGGDGGDGTGGGGSRVTLGHDTPGGDPNNPQASDKKEPSLWDKAMGPAAYGLKSAAALGFGAAAWQGVQGKNPDVFGVLDKAGGAFKGAGGVNSSMPTISNPFDQSNRSNPGAAAAEQNIPAASTVAPTDTSVAPPASPPDPNAGVASAGAAGFIRGSGSSPTAADRISQLLFPNGAPQVGRAGDEIASASVPRPRGALQSPGNFDIASAKVPGGGARHASPNVATRYQGGGGGANPYNTRTLVNNLSRYLGRGFGGQCLNRVFYQGMGGADPKANRLLDQSPHRGRYASDAIYWMKRDDRFVTVGKGYNGSSINTPGYKPQLGDVYVSTGEIGNGGVGHIQVYIGNGHWQSDGTAGGKFGDWHAADRGTEYIFRLKSDNNGAAGLADTGGGGSRDVSGMERDDYAVAFFQSKGWTREQSIGIVANLIQESRLDHNALNTSSGAYGTAQWMGSRVQDFERVMGEPLKGSSFQEQLEFVNWELNNTEKAAGDHLRQQTTIEGATSSFLQKFERPGNYAFEVPHRIEIAHDLAAGKIQTAAVEDGTTLDGGGGGSDGGGGNGPGYQEENYNFYDKAIAGLSYITKKQYNVASGKIEETRG